MEPEGLFPPSQKPSTGPYPFINQQQNNKLRGLSPRANYTNRATSACRRS
jgi:hypothetical protein